MALARHGAVVGSVSGGCIEEDLLHRYTTEAGDLARAPQQPRHVAYGISADEAHRFGLPCGGTLELLLEFDPDPHALAQLVKSLKAGQLVRRTVRLADGAMQLRNAKHNEALALDAHTLACTFGPAYRMFLIGAGQLAEYLATMASFSGFSVTVCDPRAEYRGSWKLPLVQLAADMPDDALAAFLPDPRTCVVALTHDPKLDDLALLAALDSPAFYVGAIGSRRNNLARRHRLAEHFGVDPIQLARLRGPVGLHIGSKTPAEIAVSVMAEIIATKNAVTLPHQLDIAIAKARAETSAARRAVSPHA